MKKIILTVSIMLIISLFLPVFTYGENEIPNFSTKVSQLSGVKQLVESEKILDNKILKEKKNIEEFKEMKSDKSEKRTNLKKVVEKHEISQTKLFFLKELKKIVPDLNDKEFIRKVSPFGYDFFKNQNNLYSPNVNVAVGDDYRIGPGDGLIIHVWNNTIDEVFPVEISRSGKIIIPKIGEMVVTGFNLDLLKRQLLKKVSKIYSNPQVSVSLGKVRSINVFVVGEVKNPGNYTISSLSTMLNALVISGGPTLNGSLRKIRLKRSGEEDRIIDLYDLFMKGDNSSDIRLKNGDTIFVPVIGATVLLYGNVKRVGIYEIKPGNTVDEALKMAGGITAAGFKSLVKLMRTVRGAKRIISDISSKRKYSKGLRDGDIIYVDNIYEKIENFVKIEGNVERPGEYQWIKGMKIMDLLARGIRILPETYMKKADLIREYGREKDFNYVNSSIKRKVTTELISIDLNRLLSGDKKYNIKLRPMDKLIIYSREDMSPDPAVKIAGEVRNPGSYPLYSGMKIKDLIVMAGNITKNTLLDRVEIMRRVNSTFKGHHYDEKLIVLDLGKILNGDEKENIELQNFDVVTLLKISENMLTKKVKIGGEVKNPGTYMIREGEKLSSLIRRAGGFKKNAFLKGTIFTRESVRRKQSAGLKKQIFELKKKLDEEQANIAMRTNGVKTDNMEEIKAIDIQRKRVNEFSDFKPIGRINIVMLPLKQLTGSKYDIDLKNGDSIYIPETPNDVTTIGEVVNPGSTIFEEGKNINYYINQFGGYTPYADRNRMFVVKADGTTISKYSFRRMKNRIQTRYERDLLKKISKGSFNRMIIERGDVIHVPSRILAKKTSRKELIDMIYKLTLSFAGMKAAF